VNHYLIEKMAGEHEAELRGLCARRAAGRRSGRMGPSRIRRRTGWALVSLGLRLAYAAGEG
jgi:hypothetical protein